VHGVTQKPLVVGIAGGTASGKSTLARRLAGELVELKTQLIGMDTYFRAVKPQMDGPITGEVFEDHNHPLSFDLDQLVVDLDAAVAAGEADIIIVEGLMTLAHAPLRQRLDLRVFVDTPADERIVRRLKRDMARGREYDWIANFYLESVRFRHAEFVEPSRWYADLVINGSHPSETGLAVLLEWMRSHSAAGGNGSDQGGRDGG
jgi:uridine kinase